MQKFIIILTLLCSMFVSLAEAATIVRPSKSFGGTVFINGVVPQASDFNGDVDTIYGEFNGNIDNSNIKSSAAISPTKINPDGFTANIRTLHTAPCTILEESDQGADLKRWAMCVIGGVLSFSTYSDANTLQNTWLSFARANGGFTIGGASGTNVVNGPTTFNHAVTFTGGTSLTPTGMIAMYAGTSPPVGWLLMDGASYNCTGASSANANLCAQLVATAAGYKDSSSTQVTVDTSSNEVIRTAHGKAVGDRVHFSTSNTLPAPLSSATVYCVISITADRYVISTTCGGAAVDITTTGTGTHFDHSTFTTPNAKGRNIIGTGTGVGLTARGFGQTGGEETHAMTSAENGAHTHGITDPGHTHVEKGTADGLDSGALNKLIGSNFSTATTSNFENVGSSATGISVNSSGSGTGHNVMDPFLVMTYIIKL